MRRNVKRVLASVLAVATAFALVVTAAPEASAKKKKGKDKKETKVEVDLDGVYHAYLGIQTSPHYTFRNAWDDPDYGFSTENFEQVTMWEPSDSGADVAAKAPGELNDVEIAGNGTYTVGITGLDVASEESWNLIFMSTDIPVNDTIKFTDVNLKVDGSTKWTFDEGFLDEESENYIKVLGLNTYNDELKAIYDPTSVPMGTDVEMTFTVSGFNYDNTAATGEDATEGADGAGTDADDTTGDDASVSTDTDDSTTSSDSSTTSSDSTETSDAEESSFPVVPVAIAVVVVVVIVVVVVVKKKND